MGLPIAIFAAAQFVMVLDSSVMNVSISQIVEDLDTTITGVQLAITAYTLVMAALMLAGAKLGDILGRDRTFAIGLAIYGLGSFITALSPNLTVLLIGWSLIEGIGAALVMPAIVSLIAHTYSGSQRALAFGIVGGVAGAAIAAGPLIGGWVTTELSWRYVFAGEVVIVAVILILRRRLQKTPRVENPPRLDYVGVVLSALGLGLVVFGILKSSEWGLIEPRGALTIDGREITPFGFSVVPFLLLAGAAVLAAFVALGGSPRAPGRGHAARPLAAADPAAPGRPDHAPDAAADPARHLLRPAGLPAGGARARRLRDRQATVPDVRGDVRRRDAGSEAGGRVRAQARRPGGARGALDRVRGPARDDRRGARRRPVRARAGAVRSRRRAAPLPARQRDHVRGPGRADERGRRTAGNRPEPRSLARNGADRRRADRRAQHRLRRARRAEPRGPRRDPRAGRRRRASGDPGRVGRAGRGRRARGRRARPPSPRRSRRTTATPSCTGSSGRSAPSRCSRCWRSGSPAGCLGGRSTPAAEPARPREAVS